MANQKKKLIASAERINRLLPHTGGPHRAKLLKEKKATEKQIGRIRNRERRDIRKMPGTQSTAAIIASL